MLTPLEHPALWAALLLALTAVVTDLRNRTIPNVLTVTGLGLGLAVNTIVSGPAGLTRALIGAGVGLAVFLPFFLLQGMGGGDVKLMAAIGACLGTLGVLRVALIAAFAGAVMAIAAAAASGVLIVTLRNTGRLILSWIRRGPRPTKEFSLENPAALKIPYAVPIACGVLVMVVLP